MKVLSRSFKLGNFTKHFVTIFVVTFLVLLVSTSLAFANNYETELNKAKNWLITQQQNDGGFETAGAVGFETPDVIAALASLSQLGQTYSKSQALEAVQNIKTSGKSPLDYVDDLVDSDITVGNAAKIILNVVIPLGLDPYDFDPSNDSPGARNLIAAIDSAQLPDGSFGDGIFNTTLSAALALKLVEGNIPAQTKTYVLSGQASDGSFNYAGEPTLLDGGADTTGLAIEFLVATGDSINNTELKNAVGYLARSINSDGSVSNFGVKDPNSTAATLRALNAAGIDSSNSAWRDYFAPSRINEAYVSPQAWLISQQGEAGNIISPYDSYGINTFATSQSVSALAKNVFPLVALDDFVIPVPLTNSSPVVQVGGINLSNDLPSNVSQSSGVLAETGADSDYMIFVSTVLFGLGILLVFSARRKIIR